MQPKLNMHPTLDLESVYAQLKDRYDLILTTGLKVGAGFGSPERITVCLT